jgi:hypothetical protein
MGKISPHQLSSVLEDQIRKRLMEGFNLTGGKFYYKDTNMLRLEVMYNINPLQVIYDAVDKSVIEDLEVTSLLGRDDTVISRRWGLAQDITTLKFSSTKELKLANSVKKAKTVGDLIHMSPLDEQDTRKFILFLQLAEFIDLKDKDSVDENIEDIVTTGERLDKDYAEDLEEFTESDIKIEINFQGFEAETKKDQSVVNEGISQKESISNNENSFNGEKTKVLSSEEIEKIRSEISGSSQKLDRDSIENLKIDQIPQKLENNDADKNQPNAQTGSDEIKLEINFSNLQDKGQKNGKEAQVKDAVQNRDNQIDPQRKFSEENTQVLTEEEIEQLRKLTIKD